MTRDCFYSTTDCTDTVHKRKLTTIHYIYLCEIVGGILI